MRRKWNRVDDHFSSKRVRAACETWRRATVHLIAGLVFALLALGAGAARADAVDDAFANFFEDSFPKTEQAIAGIVVAAPPHGAEILEALAGGRLFVDDAN